jgi:hypothetical protein
MKNYSSPNCVLTINGRQISEYGQSTSPVAIDQLNDKNTLVQGMNGNAIKYTRINEGYSLVVELLPGSSDANFLSALYQDPDADISAVYVTLSTLETVTLTEGVFLNQGSLGRGGEDVSDDTFTFQFNIGVKTLGGVA